MLNLGTHKVPYELQKLYEFHHKVGDEYSDIEFIGQDDNNLKLLVPKYKEQFVAFAIDGTGSVMAYWLYEDNLSIDRAPIVYLDSEGGGAVVASTSKEFLSLLPFDTSFFSEVAIHWAEYKESPKNTIAPEEEYTKEYYLSRYEYLTDAYPAYQEFRSWLSTELQIPPADNPFELIVKNIEFYPALPVE
jgi:hypothetical protein